MRIFKDIREVLGDTLECENHDGTIVYLFNFEYSYGYNDLSYDLCEIWKGELENEPYKMTDSETEEVLEWLRNEYEIDNYL